jgi:hypothetical protein
MKNIWIGIVIGLLAGGAAVWIWAGHHEGGEKETEKEAVENKSHVVHDTNGETYLKLDKEAQEHAGLKMAALEPAELKPEVKAFGRVLDPAPLATALTDIAIARSQLEASAKEAARLKLLHGQNQNVSTRALEAAEATVNRDQITLQAAELRLTANWGRALAERSDLDFFIRSLVMQQSSLVRVDVPATERVSGTPVTARLSLLSAPDKPLAAEFVAAAVAADPQAPGHGYLFVLRTNSVPANAIVTAWLSLPGEMEKGTLVPRDAIVRHEGEAFVYVQSSDEKFERKEIALEHPLASGWFVEDLKPGTKIVITGAQQLLSEELKGEGGEE